MLEKTLGVTLVKKLRAIFLMEVDFNASNKITYGVRIMGQARDHNLMPDEIYSKKMDGRQWDAHKKFFSSTLCTRLEHQLPLPQLMHLIAMAELRTRLLCWFPRHLAYPNQQFSP
jgi:hypothetical protein